MITDKAAWDYEKARLEKVSAEIKAQLDIGINATEKFKKDALEMQKQMWEDVRLAPTSLSDLEDATQVIQYQLGISNQARKYKISSEKVGRLRKMLPSPYFGRIDFAEDGEGKTEQIYIGIHNLTTSGMDILVYDWRAPISSMFYDFETGRCGYTCPVGFINGLMLLKRQYKIENGNMVYMFDSSVSINDEILREILGKSTDTRMNTIVASIQREQNTVIRNSQDRVLIVEGPAGSGKTSIALHRAAWLLYKYRDRIKSENILVFSPNHVFEDYISSVLPELGEENIQRSTFAGFFKALLGNGYRIETMNRQMEYLLSGCADETRLQCIKFKSSPEFLSILKNYVQQLETGVNLRFKSLIYNGCTVISAADIHKLFQNDYSRFPYGVRLEKLRQRLFYLMDQAKGKRTREPEDGGQETFTEEEKVKGEYASLKNEIEQMTSFDIYLLYKDLFKNIGVGTAEIADCASICDFTLRQMEKGNIHYEDMAPILYLKAMLDSTGNTKAVKHVIVDEAQDYTPIHYAVFKKIFVHCNMTILGDENQLVNGYMNIGSFGNISDIFNEPDTNRIALTKSYRSSKEIADFCKEILTSPKEAEQLDRHGSRPKLIKVEEGRLYKRLAEDISDLKKRGHKLIAVICKTAAQCEAACRSISSYMDITLISNQNEEYQGEVMVIPSYLAKGLEFDAVLVNSVEERDYSGTEDEKLLYTVCTRALHELYLYYFENMSGFVKKIGEEFYTRAGGFDVS